MAETSKLNNPILAIFKYERVRRIVAWLIEHQEELGNLDSLQLTFDCRGKDVKWTVTRRGQA